MSPDISRCPYCLGATPATPCQECGWQLGQDNAPPALALGRILDGRYRIGRVLGHGGFGITYLAWDDNLQLRLAIKEYLPRDSATRAPDGVSLSVYSGQAGEQFAYGLDGFLAEARALARFDQHPGIVTVKNFFRAHGTGYCVMDYVEGITLRQYLDQQPGGRMSVDSALKLLTPVMDALRAVHQAGLIHRDIAPDNIYLSQDGRIRLLDFGAARFAAGVHSKSLSVILKPGYAPEEQYRAKGKQGPWTDVYGLAATFYRAITGQVPPESLDRLDNDDLVPPSRLGIPITPGQEITLLKALALKAGQRFQSMAELQQAWHTGGATSSSRNINPSGPVPPVATVDPTAKPQPWAKIALLLVLVTLLLTIATTALIHFPWPGNSQPTPELAVTPPRGSTMPPAPPPVAIIVPPAPVDKLAPADPDTPTPPIAAAAPAVPEVAKAQATPATGKASTTANDAGLTAIPETPKESNLTTSQGQLSYSDKSAKTPFGNLEIRKVGELNQDAIFFEGKPLHQEDYIVITRVFNLSGGVAAIIDSSCGGSGCTPEYQIILIKNNRQYKISEKFEANLYPLTPRLEGDAIIIDLGWKNRKREFLKYINGELITESVLPKDNLEPLRDEDCDFLYGIYEIMIFHGACRIEVEYLDGLHDRNYSHLKHDPRLNLGALESLLKSYCRSKEKTPKKQFRQRVCRG